MTLQRRYLCGVGLLCAAIWPAAYAATATEDDDRFYGSVAASYVTGQYGSRQSTDITTLKPSLDWSVLPHTTLSVAVPFVSQTAPRGTVGGGGNNNGRGHRSNNQNVETPKVTTSGVGDIVLGVDQDLLTQVRTLPVDVGVFADVKLGTADVSKGLGSGKNDFSLGGRVGYDWERFTASGELGYTFVGNPGTVTANGVTTVLDYHDAAFAAIRGRYRLNDQYSFGTGLEVTGSYERHQPDTVVINANVSDHLTRHITLRGAALTGLNRYSPDFGIRASVGFDL